MKTTPSEFVVESVRGKPGPMLNVARTFLLPKGDVAGARSLAAEALALAPHDPEIQASARAIRSHGVGNWYFSMVQDAPRHELYAKALRATLVPGSTVLDIGAGTGLFAMMAAREGAGKVIACERDPAVAEAARKIVELNGLSHKVTILAKEAKDLEVGVDLEERADYLLWDNLANNLLGAGGAATIDDAKRRLLKPGAPVLPPRAEIVVALVEDLKPNNRLMGLVDGFDLTPFNELSSTNFTFKPDHFATRSEAATIFDVDFTASDPVRGERREVQVTASGGTVHGISQWVRFHLSDDLVYDTSGPDVAAFGPQFHAIDPIDVKPGQRLTIGGRHDGMLTWFWVNAG